MRTDLDDVFRSMAGKEPEHDEQHDAVVLHTVQKLSHIVGWVSQQKLMPVRFPPLHYFGYEARFEHAIHVSGVERPLFVDLAVFAYLSHEEAPEQGVLRFLLEIKSKREAQSASSWFRQVRGYAQAAGVPCILVVEHDLGATQCAYLNATNVPVLDLRTLQ